MLTAHSGRLPISYFSCLAISLPFFTVGGDLAIDRFARGCPPSTVVACLVYHNFASVFGTLEALSFYFYWMSRIPTESRWANVLKLFAVTLSESLWYNSVVLALRQILYLSLLRSPWYWVVANVYILVFAA